MDQIEQELRDLLAEIEEDLENLPKLPLYDGYTVGIYGEDGPASNAE